MPFLPLRLWGYVFGRVCLFLCLSVSRITYKVLNGFACNFYQSSVSGQGTSHHILGMLWITTRSNTQWLRRRLAVSDWLSSPQWIVCKICYVGPKGLLSESAGEGVESTRSSNQSLITIRDCSHSCIYSPAQRQREVPTTKYEKGFHTSRK